MISTPWPLATAIQALLPRAAAEGEDAIKALFHEARNLAHYGLSVPDLRSAKADVVRVSLDGTVDPQAQEKDEDEIAMTAVLLKVWGYLLQRVVNEVGALVPESPAGKAGREKTRIQQFADELMAGDWWDVQWADLATPDLEDLAAAMYQRSETYWNRWLVTESPKIGVAFDPNLTNLNAARYAQTWTDTILQGFGTTTRTGAGAILSTWASTPNANMGMLEQALMDSFSLSQSRAMMIAQTEVTRAYAQAQQASFDQFREQTGGRAEAVTIWQTMNDESVCEICSPRQGKAMGDGWYDLPPGHPRCRCFTTGEVRIVATPGDEVLPDAQS